MSMRDWLNCLLLMILIHLWLIGLCVMMAVSGVVWLDWLVIVVIVVTTVYSGVEYFVQNWSALGLKK